MKPFRRYLVGIQYDGTNYSGWGLNYEANLPSVHAVVCSALEKFVGGSAYFTNFKGSSRTDAGVHAIRNTFHVDILRRRANARVIEKSGEEDSIYFDPNDLRMGLNFFLESRKSCIHITDVQVVPNSFDSRRDAIARTYMYRIIGPIDSSSRAEDMSIFHFKKALLLTYPLQLDKMQLAGQYLLGEHDFSSFRSSDCQSKSPVKNIQEIQLVSNVEKDNWQGNESDPSNVLNLMNRNSQTICMKIVANSFLKQMVRNIMGLMLRIGRGEVPPEEMARVLALRNRRHLMAKPAPPHGLYLVDVHHNIPQADNNSTAPLKSNNAHGLSEIL